MGWFFLALAAVLGGVAVHGIATGTVFAKYVREIERASSPKMFWFVVVFYLAMAAYLARLAWFDLR